MWSLYASLSVQSVSCTDSFLSWSPGELTKELSLCIWISFWVPFLPLATALLVTSPSPPLRRRGESRRVSIHLSHHRLRRQRLFLPFPCRRYPVLPGRIRIPALSPSSPPPVQFAPSQTRLVVEIRFLFYRKIVFFQRWQGHTWPSLMRRR